MIFVTFGYLRPIWSVFNILFYAPMFICAYLILSLNMYVLCLCSNYVCARPRFIARACIVRSGCAEHVCATRELEGAVGAACSRRERSHRELGTTVPVLPRKVCVIGLSRGR